MASSFRTPGSVLIWVLALFLGWWSISSVIVNLARVPCFPVGMHGFAECQPVLASKNISIGYEAVDKKSYLFIGQCIKHVLSDFVDFKRLIATVGERIVRSNDRRFYILGYLVQAQ